jgi:hypothetical protein
VKRVRQKRYLTYHHLLEPERERGWISRDTLVREKLELSIAKLTKRPRPQGIDADRSASNSSQLGQEGHRDGHDEALDQCQRSTNALSEWVGTR